MEELLLTPKEYFDLMAYPELNASFKQRVTDRYNNKEPIKKGRMGYVFRKGNKDRPAAILIFRDWDNWIPRNLRMPGVMGETAFFTRAMSRIEMIDQYVATRMAYFIYHDWEIMCEDEQQESATKEDLIALDKFKEKYKKKLTPTLL